MIMYGRFIKRKIQFQGGPTYVVSYNNSEDILVVYNNHSYITEHNLSLPNVDLDDSCDEKIYVYLA